MTPARIKIETAEEFLDLYAARSGITVEYLLKHRQGAKPCDCDYSECEGWQIVYLDDDEGSEVEP